MGMEVVVMARPWQAVKPHDVKARIDAAVGDSTDGWRGIGGMADGGSGTCGTDADGGEAGAGDGACGEGDARRWR